MRFTIPTDQVRLVRSDVSLNLRAYVRRVNQNPTYFLVYKDVTVHMGKRRHIARMFNRYAQTPGVPIHAVAVQAMAAS